MQQHRHHGDMVIFYASEDLGNVFFFFHGDDREYFHWVSRYKLIVHSSAGIRIFFYPDFRPQRPSLASMSNIASTASAKSAGVNNRLLLCTHLQYPDRMQWH